MSNYSKFVADIGGTHARFALVDDASGPQASALVEIKVFKCADFAGPAETIVAYQNHIGGRLPSRACIAAAGPLDDGVVRFTNLDWRLSARELQTTFQLEQLELLNDFAAVAYSVTALHEREVQRLHAGQAVTGGIQTVVGAGTGLGVATLIKIGDRNKILTSEAGHTRFTPADEEQAAVLRYLHRQHDFVSMEMLLCGRGIRRLHEVLAAINGVTIEPLAAIQISRRALVGSDRHCVNTMGLYTRILAGFCAQLALTYIPRGGIYLVGDICRAIEPLLSSREFLARYLSAGAMSALVEATPLSLVLATDPGLQGAAVRANDLQRARVVD